MTFPRYQQWDRFAASFVHAKYKRHSASAGFVHDPPTTGALPLNLCWRFHPQTPIIASLSKLAMSNPARALHSLRLALHNMMTVETMNMLCLCIRLVHHWRKQLAHYCIQRWCAQVPVAALRRRLLFLKVKSQSVQACWQLSIVH